MASNSLVSSPYSPLAGVVTNPKNQQMGDNTPSTVLMNRQGDLVVSEYRGKYGAAAARGSVFMAALTSLAGTIAKFDTTNACTWTFVNPIGSGVNAEPIHFEMDILAAGPAVVNQVGFSFINQSVNALSGITKVPVPTAGLTTGNAGGFCTKLDGAAPVCYVATVATYASALTLAANWGYPMFSFPSTYLPTATLQIGPHKHEFDGRLIVPPGFALALVTGGTTAWGANTVIPSMTWMEHLV